MLYKFRIVSDEVENFKLEILIDSDDTFMRLRNAILDAVGYDRNQLDSFFICEDDWTKRTEVTQMEMDDDSEDDVWLMEDTLLSDLIEDEGQKLTFMFDYVTGRQFYMEMKEIITNKILHDPLCQRKEKLRLSLSTSMYTTRRWMLQLPTWATWAKTSMVTKVTMMKNCRRLRASKALMIDDKINLY